MDARTTPFTKLPRSVAWRAEQDMLLALERGDAAGERVLDRLLRALCEDATRCTRRSATSEPLQPT